MPMYLGDKAVSAAYLGSTVLAAGYLGASLVSGGGAPPVNTAPSAFTAGQWSVADAAIGGTATVTIAALPSNGGSAITAIQYKAGAGAWTNLGIASTGTFNITGLTNGASVNVLLRAVNAIGNGPDSDAKSVTPTAAPSEIAWTPQMASPRTGSSSMATSPYLKTDGTPATVAGDPIETLVDQSGNAGNLVSAANSAGASTTATRGVLGASETLGSVTVAPLKMNSGVLTHRYLGPANSFTMASGSTGDIIFLFARHRPAQTAVQRVAVGNSAGSFNTNIATSSTTAAGQVYTGSTAGAVKTDLTTRLEIAVQEKRVAAGNVYNLRINGTEVLGPDGVGGSVSSTGRVTLGNVYNGSVGADMDVFEFWVLPQGTTRLNVQRLEGWCAHKYGQQALLPAGHPFKDAPPMVPVGTTSTAGDLSVLGTQAQTWSVGYLSEMQTDSFYGGQQPLPSDDWAYPRDFTPAELARFKATFLPGGNYGFHGIRLPLEGFAHHRAREVDAGTGLIKKTGYLNGVLASLASFLANVIPEGGGVYPGCWGFPPWFKTNPNSGTSQYGYGTLWAGGAYARNVSLSSIRATDPTQFNIQVGLIADYMVDVLEYIHAAVPVRGFEFFNEAGNTANGIYGTVDMDDEATYVAIVKRGIEKIRASAALSTWGGQPNSVIVYANNWDGLQGRGSSLVSDAEVLSTGKTAWQEIALVTDHSITANGNDADAVKSKTTLIATNGKPFCQNEMEHFNTYTDPASGSYKTPQFRAMNLALKTANYIVVGGAIMDVPIIHFTKPLGQTDVDSNTEGYGLTQTRLPSPYGQAPTTPGDTHPEIGYGAWGEIAVNAMGVKPLLNLPKGSVIFKLDGPVIAGQQGFGWRSPNGKIGRLFVNRTATASPKTLGIPSAKVMKGKRYSYDNGEQELGTVNASRISMALPAWSCEVWVEQ